MKQTIQRILATVLCMVMVVGSGCFTLISSAAYENTYTNTGNQRADIIGVAKTQIACQINPGVQCLSVGVQGRQIFQPQF